MSSLSPMIVVVLATLTALAESPIRQPPARSTPLTITSVPVSSSVVATVATRDGQLVLLALWRGAPGWHSSGNHRSDRSGGDQRGKFFVTLQYGDRQVDLTFDSTARTATIQGRAFTVPPAANVLLVDGVDTPSRGALAKALSIDAANVDLDPRLGLPAWAQVLGRSREVVEFLQCDAFPVDPRSIEPCQFLRER